ncbi:hypothetical protein [Methylobacterium haplocladii]|uniref:hypothetical protein n=1 Tax=Methylobacterium haplocladii TaxID=1176176 RepID=UPI0011BDA3D1|nr:hypothetical protein [Methylobacterium haplocladii]
MAITRAYVLHNAITARELSALILHVHSALAGAHPMVADTAEYTDARLRGSPARSRRISW